MNLVILVFVSQGNLPSDVIKVTGKGTSIILLYYNLSGYSFSSQR